MPTLVIDIETIGEDFDVMDETTQAELTKSIGEKEGSEAYKEALDTLRRNLVFSPTTGEIVAIGVLDVGKDQGVVYFQAPGENIDEFAEENIIYKPCSERQMLESFWGGAARYDEFVTFNGRGFDVPYIVARSAKHKVTITKDLMSNRYLNSQKFDAKHIDLYDQFGYYGAVYRAGGLHLWARLFGIESPKEGEVNAGDVGKSFQEKKYTEIAKYNARDIIATKQLYEYWNEYMRVR